MALLHVHVVAASAQAPWTHSCTAVVPSQQTTGQSVAVVQAALAALVVAVHTTLLWRTMSTLPEGEAQLRALLAAGGAAQPPQTSSAAAANQGTGSVRRSIFFIWLSISGGILWSGSRSSPSRLLQRGAGWFATVSPVGFV
jgi:hypothetical protein